MTAPVIHTAQTGADTTNVTTTVAKLDTSLFSDGYTVCIGIVSDAASQVFSPPSGFTSHFGDVQVSGNTATVAFLYKRNIVKANETLNGSNYEFPVGVGTSERQSWICFAISGDGGSFDATGSPNSTGSSASATVPFLATSGIERLVVAIVGTDGATTPHTPSSMTKLGESSGSSAGSISISYETAATAGTWPSGSSVSLSTSEQWAGLSVAFSPVGSGVNVSNAVTVTETTTLSIGANVSVSDTATAAETNSAVLVFLVSVSDAAAFVEAVAAIQVYAPSVSDAVGLTEAVAVSISAATVAVSDAIAAAETTKTTIVSLIDGSEAVTFTESTTLTSLFSISVSNAVGVSEQANAAIPGVTSTQIVTSDTASLSETVTVTLGALTISVSNTITLAESVTAAKTSFISVSDGTTLVDAPVVSLSVMIGISESVTVAEGISARTVLNVSAAESIGHTETLALIGFLSVGTSNAISVAETLALSTSQPDLNRSVSDSIGHAEFVRLFMCIQKFKKTKFMRAT